jgi:hypothetical protein
MQAQRSIFSLGRSPAERISEKFVLLGSGVLLDSFLGWFFPDFSKNLGKTPTINLCLFETIDNQHFCPIQTPTIIPKIIASV